MTKSQVKTLDALWSEKVKELADFKCEICGKKNNLNSHHYIGRRSRITRWWLPNGICLCSGHHKLDLQSAHEHPDWFKKEMIIIRGNIWNKELNNRWNRYCKAEYKTIKEYLTGEIYEY